jgi:PAS domain S-box-containing protein
LSSPKLPYRELFEANPHPMWVYDLATLRFVAVNDAAVAKYGWSRDEFLAMTILAIRPPEDAPRVEATVRVVRDRIASSGLWRHRTRAGADLRVEIASHTMEFDGRPARLVVAYDVTRQHEALDAMRASEERFRIVARATTDAIWDWDLDTDAIWWNDGLRDLFGDVPEGGPPTGTSWLSRIHPDDRARVHESIRAVIRGSGDAWNDEYRFGRADGSYAVVSDRGFVIRRGDGTPTRMVGGMTDITDRRSLEQQVLRAQRLESIGTLAGGIAHDLNNMLAPILMSIELLRGHVAPGEGREILSTIEASAQRGADLVRQVLTFARGVDGQRAPIAVRELTRDIVRILVDTFPKNIQLRTEVPDGTWAVIGDRTQMHQVLLNLSVNARDAMPHGGTLLIRAENLRLDPAAAGAIPDAHAGTFVRLAVTDVGQGIAPRVLERIFEPFFTTKDVGKGTGLGLPTVQAIVRSHGGFVTVRSVPGSGTTFDVHLPADPEVTVHDGPRERRSPARGLGELILVVDDEPSIRAFTALLLERSGYRVLAAGSGDEAIATFGARARDFALVVTDLRMPGADGRAVVRAVRRLAPTVPLIAMSGLDVRTGGSDEMSDAMLLPLLKPFTAAQLDDTVRRALALRPVR